MINRDEKIIELKGICFAYQGEIALRYVTFDVFRGETVILQGPNGCGKSTLIRLLNGIIYPEQGTYRFEGDEISEKTLKNSIFSKKFHQKIGYVFQNPDVQLFCASLEEEIAFGPRQMGLDEDEVRRRTDDVIRLTGLDHLRERAPYHLSGGEKKKAALACVLSMNPEVLILDEPLAGLDRRTQTWLTDFLLQLKAAGKTMVIATHDEELAKTLGDRYIIFDDDHRATEQKSGRIPGGTESRSK